MSPTKNKVISKVKSWDQRRFPQPQPDFFVYPAGGVEEIFWLIIVVDAVVEVT
ncbi:hypothetical protein P4418_18130 [Bacillus thuringiensis]|uniref:hypothetical protein n=1 Tax=Bacillus thuringiensis TaxID=1428 RepID=UPI0018CD86A1|nr:hypothetical protein [Bacillus thuringiensis]EKS8373613.1 hypothetical protein [Bacillus cereus]MED3390726.1 hypothetical protein [Bacillus thuringiensis]